MYNNNLNVELYSLIPPNISKIFSTKAIKKIQIKTINENIKKKIKILKLLIIK